MAKTYGKTALARKKKRTVSKMGIGWLVSEAGPRPNMCPGHSINTNKHRHAWKKWLFTRYPKYIWSQISFDYCRHKHDLWWYQINGSLNLIQTLQQLCNVCTQRARIIFSAYSIFIWSCQEVKTIIWKLWTVLPWRGLNDENSSIQILSIWKLTKKIKPGKISIYKEEQQKYRKLSKKRGNLKYWMKKDKNLFWGEVD